MKKVQNKKPANSSTECAPATIRAMTVPATQPAPEVPPNLAKVAQVSKLVSEALELAEKTDLDGRGRAMSLLYAGHILLGFDPCEHCAYQAFGEAKQFAKTFHQESMKKEPSNQN